MMQQGRAYPQYRPTRLIKRTAQLHPKRATGPCQLSGQLPVAAPDGPK
jgi:hypothetical protein